VRRNRPERLCKICRIVLRLENCKFKCFKGVSEKFEFRCFAISPFFAVWRLKARSSKLDREGSRAWAELMRGRLISDRAGLLSPVIRKFSRVSVAEGSKERNGSRLRIPERTGAEHAAVQNLNGFKPPHARLLTEARTKL
jgi:hypothetical protein